MVRYAAGIFLGLSMAGLCFAGSTAPVAAQEACDRPLEEVFEGVRRSVVSIVAVSFDSSSRPAKIRSTAGTGVIIDSAGHVVTNAHVVFGGDSIAVALSEKTVATARLVGIDPVMDLAVLELAAHGEDLMPAALGDSNSLRVGQGVMAIGNSFGLGLSASQGIVSALNRVVRRSSMSWLTPLLQTDAAINAGSSGGPLVDMCGAVVGINTFRLSPSGGAGFAVPANLVKQAVDELLAQGHIARPWHGIDGRMVSLPLARLMRLPLVPGFLVEAVEPGSAADSIGLRGGNLPVRLGVEEYVIGGDIITHVNGTPLTSLATAMGIVKSLKVGDTVTVDFFRDGLSFTAESVLPARPIQDSDWSALVARQSDYRNGFSTDLAAPAE